MRSLALLVAVVLTIAPGCTHAGKPAASEARAVDEGSGRTRVPAPPVLPPREPVPVLAH